MNKVNDQTRTIKSIKNITTGLISKAVIVFLTFIDRSIFIKILGASLLGVNGLFTNILLVLSLAELGMTNKDEKKLSARMS